MVVRSLFFDATGLFAGVDQRKAAGAVGGLDHARFEAGLADQRGLLIAGNAVNRDRGAEQIRIGYAEGGRQVANVRQDGFGHAEQSEQIVIPLPAMNVEQQRARSVRRVGGVNLAAGETPQQITVDGSEREFAARGKRRVRRIFLQQPGDLRAGEIRVEQKAGLCCKRSLVPVGPQPRAKTGSPPVALARRWRGEWGVRRPFFPIRSWSPADW